MIKNSKNYLISAQDNPNILLEDLIDMWINEELKPGTLSNGTVMAYQGAVNKIKENPIVRCPLKEITSDILQAYIDNLFQTKGKHNKTLSAGYINIYIAVLNNIFRFAVFPKKYINFNPMEYVRIYRRNNKTDIFSNDEDIVNSIPVINHSQYLKIVDYLEKKKNPARLPFQIAYYTGLRIGEVCGLVWQDINLDEQYITIRRSVRYNNIRHHIEIGTPKRDKIRVVDFGNTLANILHKEKFLQHQMTYSYKNYYEKVYEQGREYYDLYSFSSDFSVFPDFNELSLVCVRDDGKPESPDTLSIVCRSLGKHFDDLKGFHFHTLRHTYTSNLISAGASPKDVQELLGHSDVGITMNIYAHADRSKKQRSARLLDYM